MSVILKYLILFVVCNNIPYILFSQGIYNNGANIIVTNGATVYIDGNANGDYRNEIDVDNHD